MSFETSSRARFDDAFANLVTSWLRADDLRRTDAPLRERAHATFALSSARSDAQVARVGLTGCN